MFKDDRIREQMSALLDGSVYHARKERERSPGHFLQPVTQEPHSSRCLLHQVLRPKERARSSQLPARKVTISVQGRPIFCEHCFAICVRCVDLHFLRGWCLERLSTSCRAHRQCRRGALATILGLDVPAWRLAQQQVNALDCICTLPVRVTPTLGAVQSAGSHSRVQEVSAVVGRVARFAIRRLPLVLARPGQVEAGCFVFEEYLLSCSTTR